MVERYITMRSSFSSWPEIKVFRIHVSSVSGAHPGTRVKVFVADNDKLKTRENKVKLTLMTTTHEMNPLLVPQLRPTPTPTLLTFPMDG